jgi:hypothetical protein
MEQARRSRRSVLGGAATLAFASAVFRGSRSAQAKVDESVVPDARMLRRFQSRYRRIVRRGLGEPYRAPLLCEPAGLHYLGGGLDPIAAIERYDSTIEDQPGGVVYINDRMIGAPDIYVDVEYPYRGLFERVLFVSYENKERFETEWQAGRLVLLNGLNCLWGAASGPLSSYRRPSHWAQPGIGVIVVERVRDNRIGEITAFGLNLTSQGPNWHARGEIAWKSLEVGYTDLLAGFHAWGHTQRSGRAILQIYACAG